MNNSSVKVIQYIRSIPDFLASLYNCVSFILLIFFCLFLRIYECIDDKLRLLSCGLIRRQAKNILYDPYANSFNFNETGDGHQDDIRIPKMKKGVFEGKYELDSLAAFIKLANHYYHATNGDLTCFLSDSLFLTAIEATLSTIIAMQAPLPSPDTPNQPYSFQRTTETATDTLMQGTIIFASSMPLFF